jgi:hypothetical protein
LLFLYFVTNSLINFDVEITSYSAAHERELETNNFIVPASQATNRNSETDARLIYGVKRQATALNVSFNLTLEILSFRDIGIVQ